MAVVPEGLAQYAGEIASFFAASVVAIGVWYNKQRRDNSKTEVQEIQDSVGGKFMKNLLDDHQRVVTELRSSEAQRISNAEKIGQLSAEVTHLREHMSEFKNLLRDVSTKLDAANLEVQSLQHQNNLQAGEIITITAERDAALRRVDELSIKVQQYAKGSL